MATIFLDTSALVRRYDRSEPGSSRVRGICARPHGHTLIVARLVTVEFASALARKARDGALTTADRTRLWRLFLAHGRDQYRMVALTEAVYARAEQLLFRHPLRAFDAMHLACALVVVASVPSLELEFWTADRRQAQAAIAEGLSVELVV